jgi:hypothetical protein
MVVVLWGWAWHLAQPVVGQCCGGCNGGVVAVNSW